MAASRRIALIALHSHAPLPLYFLFLCTPTRYRGKRQPNSDRSLRGCIPGDIIFFRVASAALYIRCIVGSVIMTAIGDEEVAEDCNCPAMVENERLAAANNSSLKVTTHILE